MISWETVYTILQVVGESRGVVSFGKQEDVLTCGRHAEIGPLFPPAFDTAGVKWWRREARASRLHPRLKNEGKACC
jgi:hypothetical protein